MTLKHMFLSTAAASSLLLAVAALEPAVFSLATKAQAATNISVSINFYDDLAPYGNWVSYHGRYVWIPEDVDAHWRPYTEGHWAYTRRYGWIWISDERFGWATYHYGRWGYARDIGWYWVPGRRWAPAWVAWSYDHYDIAWAPLPPDHYDDVNIVIYIPDYYWQAVSVSAFLSVDLSSHMFRDRDRVRRVIQRGESWTVRIEDDIIVNNVIEVDTIEKRTKKKVVILEEKAVDNPDAAGKADSNSVTIFNSEVKEETNAKPKKTRKIEEVVKEREAKGVPDEEQPSGDKATGAVAPQEEEQNAEQPATKKKQKDAAAPDQPDIEKSAQAPAEEQAAPVENKKKKGAAAPEQQAVEKSAQAPADEQTAPVINFYDDLAPYGEWVSYHGRYVWIPEDVDDRWRPYTEGHWAYTRRYGWIWISDEKFGWATYHYGRWGYGRDIGWYWVPGRRWAPAWVAWSYDDYDIAWAPLPPVHYDGVNNVISFGDIPDYHWQAVSVSAFLSVDLSSHMFRDRDRVRRVIQRGKSWTVSIENNIVVNNVITIDNIEKRTKKKVVALEEKAVDNPDAAGKADSNSVAIFNPEVKEEPNAKPKKTRKIEEVVKEREAKGIPDEEQPSGRAATTTDEPVTKPKKDEAKGIPDEEQPSGQTATTTDEPVTKPKKDKATGAVVPQDEQQNADQPTTKKKKKATELKHQSTKRVIPKTNLPDAGAESWRVNCSSRFGGFNKASETYLSSAGKRVSCARRPKNARGNSKLTSF